MRSLITGGAGFIGSNLAERLLKEGHEVIVLDNLVSGRIEFLPKNEKLHFFKGDLLDKNFADEHIKGVDMVWHLAAKPDIRTFSSEDFIKDVTITLNTLRAMEKNRIMRMMYSSSSTVYGNAKTPTPENAPLQPVSLYGASKAACESLISSYSSGSGIQACIFRFANIVGKNQTHGIMADFIKKLKTNPKKLEILGDGRQTKSYMLVDDCINAMINVVNSSTAGTNIFNLGSDDSAGVVDIANIVSSAMGLSPEYHYTGGSSGWVGDVPIMMLSTDEIKKTGWRPSYNSMKAIETAVGQLLRAEP